MLEKAPSLAADEIVLDLEDGVAVSEKDFARARVVELLSGPVLGQRTVAVRINGIGTPWCHNDIIALASLRRSGLSLVVPKVESAGDLAFINRLLAGVERAADAPQSVRVQALIETAMGLQNLAAIAAASERLVSLILGYGDLASSLGRDPIMGWGFAQDALVLAARSNGLAAIDGPHFAYSLDDQPGLRAACVEAARRGFDGKWAIHPNQVATIDRAFTPSEDEVRRAGSIISRLDAAQATGNGVTNADGGMIDEAMRAGALRVLSRAPAGVS